MKKTLVKGSLSRSSFQSIVREIKNYKEKLNQGAKLGVKEASEKLYKSITDKMDSCNLQNHKENVKLEDKSNNKVIAYRVYTNDHVIMFHEFGTGIKGEQTKWAGSFGYEVNGMGKGETGWWYPTTESDPNPYKWTDSSGQLRAFTHGLTSKLLFYNSLKDIESSLTKEIEMKIDAHMSK